MNSAITPSLNKTTEQAIRDNLPSFSFDLSDDFIGTFDGVFSREYCDGWIKHFEEADAGGLSYNRLQGMNRESHVNADQAIDYVDSRFYHNHDMAFLCPEFINKFWEVCYRLYADKFSQLKTMEMHKIYHLKIQRTKPKEGYHIWHCEDSTRQNSNRILTFIVYLNDIEDGGETEFLYLSKRVKPKAGRVVIWPAGFTHTHRGNPPLRDTKYIITGWVEF